MSRVLRPVLRRARLAGTTAAERVRLRGRSALFRAFRLTGAAVASYVVAQWLDASPQPLVAALTALLVVQVTLTETLVNGLQRVVSVVAGVGLAVLFSFVVGLTWWSLAGLIAASIVAGQLLRLGPHLVEVPISAMLVLGVGAASAESAAEGRALETLVGAVVGLLVNVLFPPAVRARDAGTQVARFAGEIAALTDAAAGAMSAPLTPEQTTRWLEDARRMTRHVPRLDRLLSEVERSRQLNVRTLAMPDADSSLRGGLDALEHCSVTIRSLMRSLDDAARARPESLTELREAFRTLLIRAGDSIRAFGKLIEAEVDSPGGPELENLADALRQLHAARLAVNDQLLIDPRRDPVLWELNGAFVAAVDRVLHELDAEDHARLRKRRTVREARRRLPAGADPLWRVHRPGNPAARKPPRS